MKTCSKCGIPKAPEDFSKRGEDLRSQCKQCEGEAYKAWATDNREKRRAINDRYETKNPDRAAQYRATFPERIKASVRNWRTKNYARYYANNKKWHAENPDCARRSGKAYRENRREEARERTKKWRQENPERENANGRIKRARKAAAEGSHTPADVHALWERQGKRCAVPGCTYQITDVRGSKHKYHVDHIIPLKPKTGPAGTNWPENLQILCCTHNVQKKNRDPREWQREHGLKQAAPEDAA